MDQDRRIVAFGFKRVPNQHGVLCDHCDEADSRIEWLAESIDFAVCQRCLDELQDAARKKYVSKDQLYLLLQIIKADPRMSTQKKNHWSFLLNSIITNIGGLISKIEGRYKSEDCQDR